MSHIIKTIDDQKIRTILKNTYIPTNGKLFALGSDSRRSKSFLV